MIRGGLRLISSVKNAGKRNFSVSSSQSSGHKWYYRVGPDPPGRLTVGLAETFGGLMWWWILWHLYHESDHIFGHYVYPDSSKWTNAELGIPADDED